MSVRFSKSFISKKGGNKILQVKKLMPTQGFEFLGLGLLACAVPIVFFIVGILLCIWVYKDAERRGMSGVLWLIVVLLTSIFGLIIYLVVRKDKGGPGPATPPPSTAPLRVCTSCGRQVPTGVKFCPNCGKPVPE